MMRDVPWIARGRKRQVERWPADREFMQRQFAEQNCARRPQTTNDFSVALRNVVEVNFRVTGRRLASDVDDVLDADGHAVQRPARLFRTNFALCFARARQYL